MLLLGTSSLWWLGGTWRGICVPSAWELCHLSVCGNFGRAILARGRMQAATSTWPYLQVRLYYPGVAGTSLMAMTSLVLYVPPRREGFCFA